MSGVVIVLALSAAFNAGFEEQPYRAGVAFFDAMGALDGTVVSVDIRMRANPRGSSPTVYVYARDGDRHYEVTVDDCPTLGEALMDSAALMPAGIGLPSSNAGPSLARADGVQYRLEAPYTQSGSGSGRITLASNNGALAEWGQRFVEILRRCNGK